MIHNSSISRILPILNLVGCVLITGLILFQWLKERRLDHRITTLTRELSESRSNYDAERKRAESLERDIVQLKDSIESAAASRKELEDAMTKLTTEQNELTANNQAAYTEQVKLWEKAISDRDERIRALNGNLVATRQRLNEAIAALKKAGAR
ncbi:MAG: hypothetical protein QM627_00665 [Luteolibacter sp.]